eukprot:TRINITY_DN1615_c0_g1_i1.p1 TRINITY_DN1615_c0_g1~~TRINITY_DN1615_c0_g1_i1.p1  ORF type:complete len:402 (+),score=47.23 TRINITY_DN1615_c0_g1_i1:96-1301(+)
MHFRCSLVLSVLSTSISCSEAKQWEAEDLANPKLDPTSCGQVRSSSVCDPEHRFSSSSENLHAALTALSADYEYLGCGGYEMAVAVVGSISGGTDYAMAKFAKLLMDRWGVGKAACNNGIVLAIAIEDRLMHIATGKGAAEHVPDRELHAVIERMKPLMREYRYVDAAEQAVSDIARVLSGESFASSTLWEFGPLVLILAIACFGCLHSHIRQRKYTRCKRVLSQIEQERAAAKAERYQAVSCAICLDTFADTPSLSTRLLVCGHKFHDKCVDDWEEAHGNCPICRESTQSDSVGGESSIASLRLQRSSSPLLAHSNYDNEYHFRIRRARALYPDFVSDSMMHRWCAPHFNGPLAADTAFIRSSPSYKDPSSSRGGGSSGGGSSSFGGGCSSGGGGAGGSW